MRQQATPVAIILLTMTLGIILPGCGSETTGPKRTSIQGTVSHDGEPIVDGEISFRPVGDKSDAPTTSGAIKDGHYEVDERYGIAAGTYSIHINSYKPLAAADNKLPGGNLDAPPGMIAREQLLPAKFNTKSTIENLTVEPDADAIEKNFELKD